MDVIGCWQIWDTTEKGTFRLNPAWIGVFWGASHPQLWPWAGSVAQDLVAGRRCWSPLRSEVTLEAQNNTPPFPGARPPGSSPREVQEMLCSSYHPLHTEQVWGHGEGRSLGAGTETAGLAQGLTPLKFTHWALGSKIQKKLSLSL